MKLTEQLKKMIIPYATAAAMAVGGTGCATTVLYDGKINHPTLDRMELVREGSDGPDRMRLYDRTEAGFDRLVWEIVNDNPEDGMRIGDVQEDAVTIFNADKTGTIYMRNSVEEILQGEVTRKVEFDHDFKTPELKHALANYHRLPGLMQTDLAKTRTPRERSTRSERSAPARLSTLDENVAEGLQEMGRIPNKMEFIQILAARQKLAEGTILHGKSTDGGISEYAKDRGIAYK